MDHSSLVHSIGPNPPHITPCTGANNDVMQSDAAKAVPQKWDFAESRVDLLRFGPLLPNSKTFQRRPHFLSFISCPNLTGDPTCSFIRPTAL